MDFDYRFGSRLIDLGSKSIIEVPNLSFVLVSNLLIYLRFQICHLGPTSRIWVALKASRIEVLEQDQREPKRGQPAEDCREPGLPAGCGAPRAGTKRRRRRETVVQRILAYG